MQVPRPVFIKEKGAALIPLLLTGNSSAHNVYANGLYSALVKQVPGYL